MKKGIKKDNYFERNRIIQQTQKYRYNFIDYLYYQGERYNKRYIRSSGNQLITLYWIGFVFLPLLPFCTPHYTLSVVMLDGHHTVFFVSQQAPQIGRKCY